jgi:hypothetical protein
MTEARLIDGLTGELIGGGNYGYTNQGSTNTQNVTQYTTQYATQQYAPQTTYYTEERRVGGTSGVIGGGLIGGQTTVVQGQGQIVNTTVNTGKEVIKGESRIEYVPFERKVIEYKD